MSEQQRIFGVLQQMIGGKKGKKGVKSDVESLIPERYKNPYVNDGSFEFKQLKSSVIAYLAEALYPEGYLSDPMGAMKAVPQETINEFLSELKMSKQQDIDHQKKLDGQRYLAADTKLKLKKKKETLEAFDEFKDASEEELYKNFKQYRNPDFDRYEKLASTKPKIGEIATEIAKRSKAKEQLDGPFGLGEGRRRKKMSISPAERKRRSDRMKALHRSGKLKK